MQIFYNIITGFLYATVAKFSACIRIKDTRIGPVTCRRYLVPNLELMALYEQDLRCNAGDDTKELRTEINAGFSWYKTLLL